MRRVEVRAGVVAGVANVPNPLDYGIFLVDVSENSRAMVVAELTRAHDAGEFLAPKPQDYGVFLAPAAYGGRQIAQAEMLR